MRWRDLRGSRPTHCCTAVRGGDCLPPPLFCSHLSLVSVPERFFRNLPQRSAR